MLKMGSWTDVDALIRQGRFTEAIFEIRRTKVHTLTEAHQLARQRRAELKAENPGDDTKIREEPTG